MLRTIAFSTAALLAALPAAAQEAAPETTPTEFHMMQLQDGQLSGPGADVILAHLPDAQFVLIGEDHGFADPPRIAAAIAAAAAPYGMNHHVIEVGGISADWARDILAAGGTDAFADALEGRPLAIPFINFQEDAELALPFLAPHDDGRVRLWGVDQEFIGSPLIHFEALADLAPTAAARAHVETLLAAETTAFDTGQQQAVFMASADQDSLAVLREHFAGSERALTIIGELQESMAIYQAIFSGDIYGSNQARISYMRDRFLSEYRRAAEIEDAPRALFKFGAIHLGLGTTFLHTFDLGSLTEGIAAANGLDTLRILISPLAGEKTNTRPSPDGVFKTGPFTSADTEKMLGTLGIAASAVPDEGYLVVPLAPARAQLGQKGLADLDPIPRSFMIGYDYLITTAGADAATPLAVK
ncbi:hypothetical protein KCG44_05070 [Pacificimonas sp. WHA3]|uniref:Erythromycin esterase n=1 Tax=Pacificimonas pallii TaxID=2827236 RepID=A0ABS6SCK3_9SPHN|nr:hypothetical protein [Pacificimonas pallii]MBV7256152.1 hypothetical protein [Pacificimonas pallii]